ncbi:MAG: barstar family protein [Candidatus Vecturithrix sp.]|jgi:RNAse (barnase) inhibitor barstar|nr:barstar family protein [Candidatus Vecturithrix sp.]
MIEEQTYDTLIQQFTTTFASNSVTVVLIEGANIYDKPSFLQEFAKKFHFPPYFGRNWDAFYDCLTDLEWFDVRNLLVIYPQASKFRTLHPEDWQIAMQILFDAADYWKQRQILFSMLFF